MNFIQIKDKNFRLYITEQQISEVITRMAQQINDELKDVNPIFIVVLNGAFIFASDLLRKLTINCDVNFIKLSSYQGTSTTGKVTEQFGLPDTISGRNVVIVEDIVDTGITLEHLHQKLIEKKVNSIKVATLIMKPSSYKKTIDVDYVGFKIANEFIVGFGLDYNEGGRNLKDIYVVNND